MIDHYNGSILTSGAITWPVGIKAALGKSNEFVGLPC